jgi:hypothetical protein
MYETWIIIEDVGVMPDYRGEWPKLAVAHITYKHKFGMPVLGKLKSEWSDDPSTYPTLAEACVDQYSFRSHHYEIQYFNDADDPREPDPLGTFAILDVTPLYGAVPPIQLCCSEIREAIFGTHIAFDTLPELKVYKYIKEKG